MKFRFAVPGTPPTVNHMYRLRRVGRRHVPVLSDEARRWMESARVHALNAAGRNWRRRRRGEKVIVRLWFYWPDGQRRDTHNMLKAIMDAWEGVLYDDDKDGLPRIMDYDVDPDNPRIVVEVEQLGEESA